MTEKIDSSVISGQVISPAIGMASQKAAQEAEKRADAEALINQLIAETKSDPNLSESERAARLSALEGARSSGNITQMNAAIANYGTSSARADGTNVVMMQAYADDPSLGYGDYNYSPAGKAFIDKQMKEAFEKSPELKLLKQRYDALPASEKESALAEQKANYKLLQKMLDDDAFKEAHESLRIMRSTGLVGGPEAQELLTKFKNGEISADVFQQKVVEGVAKIAEKNDGFINEYIKTKPKLTQDALQSEFGVEGKIDSAKLHMEWGKIRLKDKDAAYKALAENGNDVTKLTPEHQRTIHMAQIMVVVEAKTKIEGGLGIVARNQEVGRAMTDAALSVDEKMALLAAEMKRTGTAIPDKLDLRQTVLAIEETVKEGGVYNPAKIQEFMGAVGQNLKENYDELFKHKPAAQATQADVRRVDNAIEANNNQYQDLTYYMAMKNSEAERSWMSAKELADYKAQWKAIEDKMSLAYTPEARAANSLATTPAVKLTPEQQKAADDALRTENPMKAYLDAQVAAGNASPASVVQTTPDASAVPAAPPPGIAHIDGIPPLRGVTAVVQPSAAEQGEPAGHRVATGITPAQETVGQAY